MANARYSARSGVGLTGLYASRHSDQRLARCHVRLRARFRILSNVYAQCRMRGRRVSDVNRFVDRRSR
jgi:hypothetical protein